MKGSGARSRSPICLSMRPIAGAVCQDATSWGGGSLEERHGALKTLHRAWRTACLRLDSVGRRRHRAVHGLSDTPSLSMAPRVADRALVLLEAVDGYPGWQYDRNRPQYRRGQELTRRVPEGSAR